jgi:Pectate lyase superfamily protein
MLAIPLQLRTIIRSNDDTEVASTTQSPTTDKKNKQSQTKKNKYIMPKSIPQLGDSNWGIPLNAHLSQLQNPNNGGINTFEQFSQRPTNLTVDDIGKTYLYTQTGNLHQWTGTTWKVLNESLINVKDYGAVGDGVADDTAAIQRIIDRVSPLGSTLNNGQTIFFPEGIYSMNIETRSNTSILKGEGNSATFFKSFTPNGYAVVIGHNDAWKKIQIEHVCFIGDQLLTRGGIRFGRDPLFPINPADKYIGGLNLRNCCFRDLNIAFFKPHGNINNNIAACSFYQCNYHIFSLGVPAEHAGDDWITDCHFQLAQICSIYFDGKNINGTGNYVISGCTFENNQGVTIYVTDFTIDGSFAAGFLMEHNWVEETARGTALINLKGVDYTPTDLVVVNSNVNFENSSVLKCNLTSSYLFYNNCSSSVTAVPIVIKDSNSSIIITNLRVTDDSNKDFFVRDFIYAERYSNSIVSIKTKPRTVLSHSTKNVLASESFSDKNNYNVIVSGGVNSVMNTVQDGLLFDKCLEISQPTGNTFFLDNYISIPLTPNKYILYSLDAKVESGSQFSFAIGNGGGNSFSNPVVVKSKMWSSYVGITRCTTTRNTGLTLQTTDNTIARISAFQCLAFDTLQDMMEYIESGIYSTKNNIRNSAGSTFPTTGSYTKGDLIYNTNPTPGGYVGWICTASGTPGTWNTFGAIN